MDYEYDQLEIGMGAHFQKEITEEEVLRFSEMTGDKNPLHLDDSFAEQSQFGKRVVFGFLVSSYLSTIAGMHLPGTHSLILKVETNMKKPAFIGDTLTVKGTIEQKIDFGKIIILATEITNQKGDVLQEGKMHVKVLK